jgi:tRNA(fMet)-specific endonuclease VapC
MRRYLFDTGSASDWINRNGATRDRANQAARDGHVLGICTPVLAELWAGVEYSQSRDSNIPRLRQAMEHLTEWPLTTEAALEYGRLYAVTRRAGRTIGSNDLLIAAIALTLARCTVITRDADLKAVPGLQTENWFDSGK